MNLISDVTPVLTIALVISIVEFVKTHLKLSGWKVLLVALVIVAVISYLPVIITMFPTVEPWLTPILNIILLFLGAAGSFDLFVEIRTRTKE